jgi:low molecular weight protein-tyrosine phosphatase
MATILLVCTGNICRSPMAEGFVGRMLRLRGVQRVHVESSGVAGREGTPSTREAIEAVGEYGLDISGHRARRLTMGMVQSADLIVGMAAEHREAAERLAQQAGSRAFTLKELVALLELADREPAMGSPDEQLLAAVQAAEAERGRGRLDLMDEDVADPLGLGIESYRAVAWELEDLSRRLVEALFPQGAAKTRSDEADGIWGSGSEEEDAG